MKKGFFLILGLLLISLIVFCIHLLSTSLYKSSEAGIYELRISRYKFNDTLDFDKKNYGRADLLEINENEEKKTIASSRFLDINSIYEIEWASTYGMVNDSLSFELPIKLANDFVDADFKGEIPIADRLDNYYDINNDGLLDKFGFVYYPDDNTDFFIAICLNNGDKTYETFRSGYLDNPDLVVSLSVDSCKAWIYLEEERREMHWLRKVTFSLDTLSQNNHFILSEDYFVVREGNLHIDNEEEIGQVYLNENYTLPMPIELQHIRDNYYEYPYINDADWEESYIEPEEYIETISFLDSIGNNKEISLKPMKYNLSKFAYYHGEYYRSIDDEGKGYVEVNENGNLTLGGITGLTINGNGAEILNFSSSDAIISLVAVQEVALNNMSLYHDVKKYGCIAPVVSVLSSILPTFTGVTFDGCGRVGIISGESNIRLSNCIITNCTYSAIRAEDNSEIIANNIIIEKNLGAISLISTELSKIEINNSIIRNNFTEYLARNNSFGFGEIDINNTQIYENYTQYRREFHVPDSIFVNNEMSKNYFDVFSSLDKTLAFAKELHKYKKLNAFFDVSNLEYLIKYVPINEQNFSIYKEIAHLLDKNNYYKEASYVSEKIEESFPN